MFLAAHAERNRIPEAVPALHLGLLVCTRASLPPWREMAVETVCPDTGMWGGHSIQSRSRCDSRVEQNDGIAVVCLWLLFVILLVAMIC